MVAQLVRAAFVAMQLNKVTPWRLLKMFQTIFVGVSTLVMWCTFCFLWRNQPAKMAALTMGSPCSWMDIPRSAEGHLAHPLRARSHLHRPLAGIAVNRMQVDDSSFELIPGRPTTVTAIASGAILCILTFGLKNSGASMWNRGSLVVMKDDLRTLLLPSHMLKLARTAHAPCSRCSTPLSTMQRSSAKWKRQTPVPKASWAAQYLLHGSVLSTRCRCQRHFN
jgi:hypothetical protein